MEDKLIKKMNNLTMVLIIATITAMMGFVNTLFLSHRITELENKIEAIKTFKSE